MTPAEAGFLLLTSHLGNPERKPLTAAQFRNLSKRVRNAIKPAASRVLCSSDIQRIGYSKKNADIIVDLLEETDLLNRYIEKASNINIFPLTRNNPLYPAALRHHLGDDAPACLWYKGNPELLNHPCVGLVGSRNLAPANQTFAQKAGNEIARQGYTLVSGNARGADQAAQSSAISSGGAVISVVADALTDKPLNESVLYLSEYDYDAPFSSARALSRNRIIHSLGRCTLVAQCQLQAGGSWRGAVTNLQFGWTPVCCFNDGSAAPQALEERGALLISKETLCDLSSLFQKQPNFFDM